MLGLSKAGTAGTSATAGSARSRDTYQRYSAVLYRQALLSLDDSAYPRDIGALWRAVLRRLTTSSAAAQYSDQGRDAGHPG
jgi:hypothetical protein